MSYRPIHIHNKLERSANKDTVFYHHVSLGVKAGILTPIYSVLNSVFNCDLHWHAAYPLYLGINCGHMHVWTYHMIQCLTMQIACNIHVVCIIMIIVHTAD